MNIEEQFNKIAQEYDRNRRKFIPCFEDFYETATRLIASGISAPSRILDLGAGTGLLSYYWFRCFPDSRFLLTDIADEMLSIARRRFSGLDNVDFELSDYNKGLPERDFDAVISALSVHHLNDGEKAALFKKIFDKLPEGGVFVNYDQFCGGQEDIDRLFDSFWENQILSSGLSEKDVELWRERRRLDLECSAEWEVNALRNCGFGTVRVIYSYHKFSVIMAVK